MSEDQKMISWTMRGFNYLRREEFEQSRKCFSSFGHEKGVLTCEALSELREIQKKEYQNYYLLNALELPSSNFHEKMTN